MGCLADFNRSYYSAILSLKDSPHRFHFKACPIFRILALSILLSVSGCDSSSTNTENAADSALSQQAGQTAEVPLVTLKHWRDSTPGERYSFLIGFVTMLELEKEWQGRVGGEILPFEKSLTSSWVSGFADRPLTELYNGLNKYISDHQSELDRPISEVMWFIFVQPRLNESGLNKESVQDEPMVENEMDNN